MDCVINQGARWIYNDFAYVHASSDFSLSNLARVFKQALDNCSFLLNTLLPGQNHSILMAKA